MFGNEECKIQLKNENDMPFNKISNIKKKKY